LDTKTQAKGPCGMLALREIRTDGDTQARWRLDQATVDAYAELLKDKVNLPPAVVFNDGGVHFWLADGFHRHAAHAKAGLTSMLCEVRKGTQRDALLYAVGANAEHGLPRSNSDKHRAVTLLLCDPEWSRWSDREIARRAAVSHNFVSQLRRAHLSSDDRCAPP